MVTRDPVKGIAVALPSFMEITPLAKLNTVGLLPETVVLRESEEEVAPIAGLLTKVAFLMLRVIVWSAKFPCCSTSLIVVSLLRESITVLSNKEDPKIIIVDNPI